MAEKGLLFMPDISGFTNFVNKTEAEHSRFIIQELLETLVNSNKLRLNISEIEGDAILFYRFGNPPPLNELFDQVEVMFQNFHRTLKRNSARRICQCNACKSADSLTLKVFCHTGEFSTYNVKEFSKLIGKDVIAIHHLLKNDIPLHEYFLITDACLRDQLQHFKLPAGLQWERGIKTTDSGAINFHYSLLSPLKDQVLPAEEVSPGIKGKRVKMITLEKEIDTDLQRLFAVIGDLSHRPEWMNVKGVDKISTPINQVGTTHHCILDKEIEIMTTSDFQGNENEIIMEETDAKKMITLQFHLTKLAESKTKLSVNLFMKKNYLMIAAFHLLMKKKFRNSMQSSIDKLSEFAKTDVAAGCQC